MWSTQSVFAECERAAIKNRFSASITGASSRGEQSLRRQHGLKGHRHSAQETSESAKCGAAGTKTELTVAQAHLREWEKAGTSSTELGSGLLT